MAAVGVAGSWRLLGYFLEAVESLRLEPHEGSDVRGTFGLDLRGDVDEYQ